MFVDGVCRAAPGFARVCSIVRDRIATMDEYIFCELSPNSLLCQGLLWVQHDKLFSRWKERFVILTTDYVQVGAGQSTYNNPINDNLYLHLLFVCLTAKVTPFTKCLSEIKRTILTWFSSSFTRQQSTTTS